MASDCLGGMHNQYRFTRYGSEVTSVAKRYSPCDSEKCWHRDSVGDQYCPVATLGLLLGLVAVEGVVRDVLSEFDIGVHRVSEYIRANIKRELPMSYRFGVRWMTRDTQDVLGIHSWHALFEYQGHRETMGRYMSPEFMLLGLIRHYANEAVEAFDVDPYRVRTRFLEVMVERNIQVAMTPTSLC